MSKRNLIIIVLVLGIIAVVTQYVSSHKNSPMDKKVGQPLVKTDLIGSIDELVIKESKGEIHLHKQSGQWLVKQRDDFPVNLKKLRDLFDNLTTYHVSSLVTKNPHRLAHFKVLYLSEKYDKSKSTGIQLILKEQGKEIYTLVAGKSRDAAATKKQPQQSADGTYVRIGYDPLVYLIKENLSFNSSPDSWIQKTLISLEKGSINAIRFNMPDEKYAFVRKEPKADLLLSNQTSEEQINKSELSNIIDNLENFEIEEILKRSKKHDRLLELKSEIVVEMADLSTFEFQILTETKAAPAPLKDDQDAEEVKYYVKILEPVGTAINENQKTLYRIAKKWLFEVDEWQAKKWLKKRADYIESKG